MKILAMRDRMLAALLVLSALAAGCSGYRTYRSAQGAEAVGDWDQAVIGYMQLVHDNPSDLRYRSALLRAKIQASHQHFDKSKRYREAGLLRQAMVELQKAVQLDTTNQYAEAELVKVRAELEAERNGAAPSTIAELKERTRGSLGQPPVLNPRSDQPIDLDFPEPVSVKKIYQALGKAYGINVLFDPKLRDQEISITLRQVTAQDALEILMRTSGHFYKVIDEQSIIVVADTPQNRRAYEDLIIQTFFLSNSDVKDVMAMLRSLVDARKVASNEQLNAIILRDTADKVKVAERIIEANDKAKAELVIDVELLLLNTNALQDLGVSLSSYAVGLEIDTGVGDQPLHLSDLENLTENDWAITVPSFIFDFLKQATEAQTLAKPQLRITEGEKARLRIGDRVPIPVTSFNSANAPGGSVVPITSFQYQDVGIIIEVEPRVHHNEEITLKISVEISNIAGKIDDQPIIGTRNIETTIRLQDGETNFLAGLIRTDESSNQRGVAGLSEIPLLGRLFTRKHTENQRTDIVLTLTPHIIRRANITEQDLTPIWVGTESNITFRGGSPRVESESEGPFEDDAGADVEDAQERLRRRLQQLPRGLRDPTQEQPEQEEPGPAGIELVPGLPPSSFEQPEEGEVEPEVPEEVPEPEEPQALLAEPAQGEIVRTSLVESGGEPLLRSLAGSLRPAAEVRVVPQALSVRAGDEFEVRLEVRSRESLAHVPMTLLYATETLEFLRARPGEFLGGEGEATVMASAAEQPGRLVIGASRLGPLPGVAGSGVVVYLRFRALAAGESLLRFEEVSVLDADLLRLRKVTSEGGRVEVAPARPDGSDPPARPERPERPRPPVALRVEGSPATVLAAEEGR